MKDNGSRSGQLEDAQYIVSLFWIGLSRGPPHDEWYCVVKQYGGQFRVMQPDWSEVVQFSLIPEVDDGEQVGASDDRQFLTVIKKFLIGMVMDRNTVRWLMFPMGFFF